MTSPACDYCNTQTHALSGGKRLVAMRKYCKGVVVFDKLLRLYSA